MGKSPRVSASEAMPFRPSAQILPRVARRRSAAPAANPARHPASQRYSNHHAHRSSSDTFCKTIIVFALPKTAN